MPKPNVFRGVSSVSALLLACSTVMGMIFEKYYVGMDQTLGTQSTKVITEKKEGGKSEWKYKNEFHSAQEAIDGYKKVAEDIADESFVLLKNTNNTLPLTQESPKVSLFGLRSYACFYGNDGGSIADFGTVVDGNTLTESFAAEGLQLNPTRISTYEKYLDQKGNTFGSSGFGAKAPEYPSVQGKHVAMNREDPESGNIESIVEVSPDEMAALDPSYAKDDAQYADAAIVVFGRPGGEGNNYRAGADAIKDGSVTTTGNIMGLSEKEKAVLQEAESKFDKVIVLINSTQVMEIKELKDDPKVGAIMWIGYPGAYGFHEVAKVLEGKVNPSGRLGETFATNGAAAPSMVNFGDKTKWPTVEGAENINSYVVENEGIYDGYRYYETRYEDVLNHVAGASTAKAGTYTIGNGALGTTDGTWSYDQEVVYPFGYGLSYTNFNEEFVGKPEISGDKKTAKVQVRVTNTGKVTGKHAVGVYGKAPYTDYDKQYGVEKSAIQLLDFEKTPLLNPEQSATITMTIDMANLASYDSKNKKTFIVEDGDYYLALGSSAHDALNNVLKDEGKDVDGNAAKAYKWSWKDAGGVDDATFSVSDANTKITNHLSGDNEDSDYAMDFNAFNKDSVTYLSRSNWNGTFPTVISNVQVTDRMKKLLSCDFVDIDVNSTEAGDYKWGVKNGLNINMFQNADWDDPRWNDLVDQVTPAEFIDFSSNAFHNLQNIDSVGLAKFNADDGPGGSDSHNFNEGKNVGSNEVWADADSAAKVASSNTKGVTLEGKNRAGETTYTYKGTRVTPAQTNIAYTWNKELAYRDGEVILGETSLIFNLPIIIGPAMNLKRNGYNGRSGEYLAEDPILSGYIGSAIVQGAQSKGCIVNIKHAAFNDQEINRSGVAIFMNEQKARELELRNLNQAFTAKGKPASFVNDETKKDTYTQGALGVMTSYNRIGIVPSSANKSVMVDIMRNEWGFHGYNVTDFTGLSLKASPKESIMAGTTAFCGFGVDKTIQNQYYNADMIAKDPKMAAAMKQDIKYILFTVCHSNVVNNTDVTFRTVKQMTSWRRLYISLITVFGVLTVGFGATAIVFGLKKRKED